MKRAFAWGLTVVASLLALAGLAVMPLLSESWEHERMCEKNLDRIETALAPFNVLDAAPAGEPDRSCADTDDHHASACVAREVDGAEVGLEVSSGPESEDALYTVTAFTWPR